MPEAVQVFIAPPDPVEALRERLSGRGTDSAEADRRAACAVAELELAAQDDFHHQVVNDDAASVRRTNSRP